jgi:CheY-like chemotaxis protein
MNSKPILYAEDEPDDVFFLRRACQRVGLLNPLLSVADGQEVIDYLSGDGKYSDRKQYPLPCLVLLDLKMPRKSGLEALRWIRKQDELREMLVIMFSSSNLDRDIQAAHDSGANDYLVKPSTPDKLVDVVRSIKETWLTSGQPAKPGTAQSA